MQRPPPFYPGSFHVRVTRTVPSSAKGKILVIRGGAIGDFILTLPVLAALRERFPDVRLELLSYPRVAPLAVAGGLAHHAQSIDARPLASFFARGGPLPAQLADYFGSFALIISYLFDPDRIFQDNVARCSKAQFLVGPHRPDERTDQHATEAFLRPLERLAIFDADPIPRLDLSAHPRSENALVLQPSPLPSANTADPLQLEHWLALHPGSGSERKNWPEESWEKLLVQLQSTTRLRFLLIGGEAEGQRLGRLAALVSQERLRVAESLSLTELAVLLGQCWGYIGHDSGISHLAAAVGLQSLILWGATKQSVWRPRNARVYLLSAPAGLPAVSVEDVLAAIRRQLAETAP